MHLRRVALVIGLAVVVGGCHGFLPFGSAPADRRSPGDSSLDRSPGDAPLVGERGDAARADVPRRDAPPADAPRPDAPPGWERKLDLPTAKDLSIDGPKPPAYWSRALSGAAGENGVSVAITPSGNVCVGGYFVSPSFDAGGPPLTFAGGYWDGFLGCYTAGGQHLWSSGSGASGEDYVRAIAAGNGKVYALGFFGGTFPCGATPVTATALFDIFLATYSESGAAGWCKTFGSTAGSGASGEDMGYAVAADAQGNIYISGHVGGPVDFGGGPRGGTGKSNIFLASFDAAGAHRWSNAWEVNGPDWAYWLVLDASANVYLTGFFTNPKLDLGGGPLSFAGYDDVFIASFTSGGQHRWSTGIGSLGYDRGEAIAVDTAGNLYLAAYLGAAMTLGGSPLAHKGGTDVLVASYTTDGTFRWARAWGSTGNDVPRSLAVDGSGNVLVAGYQAGPIDYGKGTIGTQSTDAVVLSLDSLGNTRWAKAFGAAGIDRAQGIAARGSQVALTGEFQEIVDFGHGPLISAGGFDAFLLTLAP